MIDFIAYHDLQAQCASSVYNELSKTHECRWRINPDQKYDGSDTLIMLDHAPHHHDLHGKYKRAFHLPHDIGEFKVYAHEYGYLRNYTAIFAPTNIHYKVISETIPCEVIKCGWPKYDALRNTSMSADDIVYNIKMRRQPAIMYAPTSANTWEWVTLLDKLFKLDVTIIVKNHIYVNAGQPFPPGAEAAYTEMLKSAAQMEAYALKCNAIVAPRKLNACELFPHIDYLISDQSSLLAEFLPFGVPIETGRYDDNPAHVDYQMSDIFKCIYKYQYIGDIMELPRMSGDDVTYDSNRRYGKEIADAIRERI